MDVDIDIGAVVYTVHGHRFGKVAAVVIDRDLQEATHLVVRRGYVFPADVVVPMGYVGQIEDRSVTLTISGEEAAHLPSLEAEASEPLEVSDQDASGLGPPMGENIWADGPPVALPPLLTTATSVQPYVVERWRNVPPESLVLTDGLPVRGSDGRVVGFVDQLVVDPKSGAVTHIVVRGGGIRYQEKAVPVGWIEESDEDTGIVLAVPSKQVQELPIHRRQ